MDPVVKRVIEEIKKHKKAIERLEATRDTLMAFDRGEKKRAKGKKKAK